MKFNSRRAAWHILCALLVALITAQANFAQALSASKMSKTLQIYFIDVEGGQSTLVVAPDRHAFLIDTGFPGKGEMSSRPGNPADARDANRIVAAARDAGIGHIDALLITHFHPDHDGGVVELSQLMSIGNFIDHGSISADAATNADYKAAYDSYTTVRASSSRFEPTPGALLPLKYLDVTVVSSAGATLANPLPNAGKANSACAAAATAALDPYENPRSTGVVIRYGKFRFLDVGDLSGQPLFNLVCPRDMIGPVDVYLVAHHGGSDVADPATFAAFNARVVVMNNGRTKGGARTTYEVLHHVTGLEDVWQLHASTEAGESNFPPQFIANLDETSAFWIKLEAKEDGSFRVFNQRTGQYKSYAVRRSNNH